MSLFHLVAGTLHIIGIMCVIISRSDEHSLQPTFVIVKTFLVIYCTTLSELCIASIGSIIDGRNGKDLEGSSRGLIELLPQHSL
jgi:hypothetical protein